jgi:hypothetical protein
MSRDKTDEMENLKNPKGCCCDKVAEGAESIEKIVCLGQFFAT